MAEKHRFQAQEGHRLCVNNCGFLGSPTTSNLCSKCFRDLRMKDEQSALAKSALDGNNTAKSPLASVSSSSALSLPDPAIAAVDLAVQPVVSRPNRCLLCRKRVGLTGFSCRCGSVFCGSHRYPEQHGCTFDYKTAGREAIAKANPVVKATKLARI